MTIDEWIETSKLNAKVNREHPTDEMLLQEAEEYEQLTEWLEDYKRLKSEKEQDIYERAYRDGQDKGLSDGHFVGYNKAIDDFVEKLKSDEFQKYKLDMVFETSRDLTYSQCVNAFHEYIDEITKQLKEGA